MEKRFLAWQEYTAFDVTTFLFHVSLCRGVVPNER